jgi:hypothetical protein
MVGTVIESRLLSTLAIRSLIDSKLVSTLTLGKISFISMTIIGTISEHRPEGPPNTNMNDMSSMKSRHKVTRVPFQ